MDKATHIRRSHLCIVARRISGTSTPGYFAMLNNLARLSTFCVLAACVGPFDDPADEVSCTDGECDSLGDGLGDFYSVTIDRNAMTYYLCPDVAFDYRCLNRDTDGQAHTYPNKLSAEAEVTWVKDNKTIFIRAQDTRLLALSNRPIHIYEVAQSNYNPFGLDKAGLALDYRVDGETEWKQVRLDDYRYWYWSDIYIDLVNGRFAGTSWQCTNAYCIGVGKDSQPLPPVASWQKVEYRLSLIPLWNHGDLDTGNYTISFRVE